MYTFIYAMEGTVLSRLISKIIIIIPLEESLRLSKNDHYLPVNIFKSLSPTKVGVISEIVSTGFIYIIGGIPRVWS